MEATLELMQTGAVISIQDMGAAGLTCSAVEMGDKGKLGVRLDLEKVPCREENMTAYEMMLSESQERMLMVLRPEKEDEARAVFEKWDLDFAIVGETIAEDRFLIMHHNEAKADLPLSKLSSEAPEYDRPWEATPAAEALADVPQIDPIDGLRALISSPNYAAKQWVYEQYDTTVMADSAHRPGLGAGIIRVHGTDKLLAFTSDVTPRYVRANPVEGGKQAVAEAYRNLTAVGATPLASTDNLNFGNPEKPEIMGQFVGAIKGIGAACSALDMPIVSGNVSLYNETDGQAILPTPTIGAVGLIAHEDEVIGTHVREGHVALLVGETEGHLGQSALLAEVFNREDGDAPGGGSGGGKAQRRFHPRQPRSDHRLHRPVRRRAGAGRVRAGRRFRRRRAPGCGRHRDPVRRGSGPLPDRLQLRPGRGADDRRRSSRCADVLGWTFHWGNCTFRRLRGAARGAFGAVPRQLRTGAGLTPGAAAPNFILTTSVAALARHALAPYIWTRDQQEFARMAMQAHDIEALIRASFPSAKITITDLAGDGNHWAAEVIDESFRGQSRVQQQRAVNAAVKSEIDSGRLHALALTTKAPD